LSRWNSGERLERSSAKKAGRLELRRGGKKGAIRFERGAVASPLRRGRGGEGHLGRGKEKKRERPSLSAMKKRSVFYFLGGKKKRGEKRGEPSYILDHTISPSTTNITRKRIRKKTAYYTSFPPIIEKKGGEGSLEPSLRGEPLLFLSLISLEEKGKREERKEEILNFYFSRERKKKGSRSQKITFYLGGEGEGRRVLFVLLTARGEKKFSLCAGLSLFFFFSARWGESAVPLRLPRKRSSLFGLSDVEPRREGEGEGLARRGRKIAAVGKKESRDAESISAKEGKEKRVQALRFTGEEKSGRLVTSADTEAQRTK